MAVVAPDLQREQLRTELQQQERRLIDGIPAKEAKERELNNAEQAALTATINNLLRGRDAWLKQMREAKMREARRAFLTAKEEGDLNKQVRALLIAEKADLENEVALKKFREKQNFIANFTYESDAVPEPAPAAPATGLEGMLNGMLSKMTGIFGDSNSPFAAIGKFLMQIFSFIIPMISVFKDAFKDMEKKTPAELIKEGSLDEADAELTMQEEELMSKLSDIKEMGEVLDTYKAELEKLKTVEVDGQQIPFADATEAYKRKILVSRSELLKKASPVVTPGLAAHAEFVVAKQRRDLKGKQLKEKQGERAKLDPEKGGEEAAAVLNLDARIQAIKTEFEDLERAAEKLKKQEDLFVAHKDEMKTQIENSLQIAKPVLTAEQTKQRDMREAKKLEMKTKADREHQQYEQQMRQAQAEEARKVEAHQANMAKLAAETAKAEAKARAAAMAVVPPPDAAPPAPAVA